jgi:hypothetical protein
MSRKKLRLIVSGISQGRKQGLEAMVEEDTRYFLKKSPTGLFSLSKCTDPPSETRSTPDLEGIVQLACINSASKQSDGKFKLTIIIDTEVEGVKVPKEIIVDILKKLGLFSEW